MPLIVLEGPDGCGKTTQVGLLKQKLPDTTLFLREPGGTKLGEALRSLILDPASNIASKTELLLYLAARSQLVSEVIKPALDKKQLVVMDRFFYSTIAYQIVGLDFSNKVLWTDLIREIVKNVEPDLIVWFDIPLEACLQRFSTRSKDRIEQRGIEYFTRVHECYSEMMGIEGVRIDAAQSIDDVNRDVMLALKPYLPK